MIYCKINQMKRAMVNLQENIEFCQDMLPKVSRTFAPTIRMLPKKLNLQVAVSLFVVSHRRYSRG